MSWRDVIELSFRNLTSRKSRSLLTVGGMAVGIMAVIFLVSIGYGIQDLAIRETIQSKSLNVFDASVGTGLLRRIDSTTITKIKSFNGVTNVYPQLETPAKLSLPNSDSKVDLIALINDSAYEAQTDTQLTQGRSFHDDSDELIISTAALDLIGAKADQAINAKVVLAPLIKSDFLEQSSEAASNSTPSTTFTIVGIVDDSDSPYVSVPIAPVAKVFGQIAFSAVKVEVEKRDEIETIREQVGDLGGLETEYIGDVVSQLESVFRVARLVLGGLGLVATFVAALGMFNTLSVSLLERTREIGIMKTLGTRRNEVRRLFLIEGMLISIVGGVVGIILGILLGEGLNGLVNIVARATGNPTVDFYSVPLLFIALILGLVIVLGIIVGFIPARRATKISPLEALRYE